MESGGGVSLSKDLRAKTVSCCISPGINLGPRSSPWAALAKPEVTQHSQAQNHHCRCAPLSSTEAEGSRRRWVCGAQTTNLTSLRPPLCTLSVAENSSGSEFLPLFNGEQLAGSVTGRKRRKAVCRGLCVCVF